MKRVFVIVADSFGIGSAPDAADFGDEGANTLLSCYRTGLLSVPNLARLGLFNIDGVDCGEKASSPISDYGRLRELSRGKDTTIGHWELAGIVSEKPLPTYPNGFPPEVIAEFEKATGRKVLCNRPYSGTKVIADYGEEHMKTGSLIVYTSADSVFQVAAHEDVVPVETLYEYCRAARRILTGDHNVGRVIARPFVGVPGNFTRTKNRHDFSVEPPSATMLDELKEAGFDVIGVGKIGDIFCGRGLTASVRTSGNEDGMDKTIAYAKEDFCGLCFVNLVDFDMLYGHRNDPCGYAQALSAFDKRLGELIALLGSEDLLIITADHGCDPTFPGTDHTREYVPFLYYAENCGKNLGTLEGFFHVSRAVKAWLL